MIRFTVGKLFSPHRSNLLILDDQQRFARMLIFAAISHLVFFLYFDFKAYNPPMKTLATMIEVNLSPPEQIEIEFSQSPQTSPAVNKDITNQEGISFVPKLNSALRKRTISAASHEKRDASYLNRWQAYVENYGNNHYPSVALHNNLRGDLRLLVALRKDGTIHEVSIRRSSGKAELDEAAIKLVYQAAPFEPLPAEITNDTDILEIIRTWQFRGELSTS